MTLASSAHRADPRILLKGAKIAVEQSNKKGGTETISDNNSEVSKLSTSSSAETCSEA